MGTVIIRICIVFSAFQVYILCWHLGFVSPLSPQPALSNSSSAGLRFVVFPEITFESLDKEGDLVAFNQSWVCGHVISRANEWVNITHFQNVTCPAAAFHYARVSEKMWISVSSFNGSLSAIVAHQCNVASLERRFASPAQSLNISLIFSNK